MLLKSAGATLGGLALMVATTFTQTPAPAPPQTAGPQAPTFRAAVTLVTTDVVTRDSGGRFLSDLTKDDFTVLEDGVKQSITSFSLVHGGRTFTSLEPSAPTAPEGIILPTAPRKQASDSTGRVLLIFVDDLHFEPEYSPNVRKLYSTLVDTLVHEGDLTAVVSSGPSSIEIQPTYDRKLVAAAVSKIRGSAMTPAEMFKTIDTSQGPGDIRQRAQTAFYAAYNIVADLEKVQNKRKAILYISTGYDFDPFADSRRGRDRIQGGRFSEPSRFYQDEENPFFRMPGVNADIELYRYMRELTLSANRANASIFTIDPRGLAGIVDAGQYLDQSEWRTYLQKSQSSLRYLAETTGGFAIVNDNDFATAFKRIDAETSDYYVIGYYSSNPDPTKRVRQLDVKVDRPNVTVFARREYSLKTPGTPAAPKKK